MADDDTMPECVCIERGQPMTEFGVMHLTNCMFIDWLLRTGGCQGDG